MDIDDDDMAKRKEVTPTAKRLLPSNTFKPLLQRFTPNLVLELLLVVIVQAEIVVVVFVTDPMKRMG